MSEKKEPFIVSSALFKHTRLIDTNGDYYESKSFTDASRIAFDSGLDLVCFNEPTENQLALCKIIDYGKWKYQREKELKKAEKKTKHETKEMRFSSVISENDVAHKLKHVKEFVERGDNVVISIQGLSYSEKQVNEARIKMEEILVKCSAFAKEVSRKQEGGRFYVTITKK